MMLKVPNQESLNGIDENQESENPGGQIARNLR